MILRVGLFVLAAVMLAAHFLREGSLVPAMASLLVPLLFLVRKGWSLLVLQLSAYLAAAIWIHATILLVRERFAAGLPWTRAAFILGGVALLSLLSRLLLNSR